MARGGSSIGRREFIKGASLGALGAGLAVSGGVGWTGLGASERSFNGAIEDPAVCGWTGKILRVDLSNRKVEIQDSLRFAKAYLGGRGFAARLAWEELKPGIGAFDPENMLMFMPGGLAGTPAPSSGRTSVCAVSPQAYPEEWYTRSNMGGHWGTELKYAGYDGVVVVGASEEPVYLWIEDGCVEIRAAGHLWGKGIFDTQKELLGALGDDVRVLCIGQAGERLSRIAIIATETEAAAGQGGFGGVMGSKGLKAIAVRGHGAVRVADPGELIRRYRVILEGLGFRFGQQRRREKAESGECGTKLYACTQHCPRQCASIHTRVPGVVHKDRIYSGMTYCAGGDVGGKFGKEIEFRARTEIALLCSDYGINHWDLIFAIRPWIVGCQDRGELLELDGAPVNLDDPGFWVEMVRKMAFREGYGDLFAEGGIRAAKTLGIGEDIIAKHYPAYGQASHWDGRGSTPRLAFPHWLVTGLQWAMDTRDPMGGGHGYTSNMFWLGHREVKEGEEKQVQMRDQIRRLGECVYGHPSAADPWAGYEGKAYSASYHCDLSPLKDSMGICDNIFPVIVNSNAEDLLVRAGEIEGRHFEWYMAGPAFGEDWTRESFYRIGTRVFTMERAVQIRNWGRTRRTDETVIPYLSQPESHSSPYTGKAMALDREAFGRLMDEYYDLRGWDRETGWPYRVTWERLGMRDVANELERLGKLPT